MIVAAFHIDDCGIAITDDGYGWFNLTHLNSGFALLSQVPDLTTAMKVLEVFKGVCDYWGSLNIGDVKRNCGIAGSLALATELDTE